MRFGGFLSVWAILTQTISSTCVAGDDKFCVSCSVGTNSCAKCINSYISPNGSCGRLAVNITNCETYKDSSYCDRCAAGYMPYERGCVSHGIDGCAWVQPSNKTSCAVCYNSTLPDAAGRCSSSGKRCSDTNCLYCSAIGSCMECKAGFYLSADGMACRTYPAPTPDWLKNCRQAGFSGTCYACANGTYTSQSMCLPSNDTAIPWKQGVMPVLFTAFFLVFFV